MDEQMWVAAMRANPLCLRTLGAFADWLCENGDPRWEPAMWMFDNDKIGGERGYHNAKYYSFTAYTIPESWYNRSIPPLRTSGGDTEFFDNIANRMSLLANWLPSDTQVEAEADDVAGSDDIADGPGVGGEVSASGLTEPLVEADGA